MKPKQDLLGMTRKEYRTDLLDALELGKRIGRQELIMEDLLRVTHEHSEVLKDEIKQANLKLGL